MLPCRILMIRTIFGPAGKTLKISADTGRPSLAFQSTLPVWGATQCALPLRLSLHDFNPRSPCGERLSQILPDDPHPYFNPRSPCGERPYGELSKITRIPISIHAPRVGSDLRLVVTLYSVAAFQSTLPVWGATLDRL